MGQHNTRHPYFSSHQYHGDGATSIILNPKHFRSSTISIVESNSTNNSLGMYPKRLMALFVVSMFGNGHACVIPLALNQTAASLRHGIPPLRDGVDGYCNPFATADRYSVRMGILDHPEAYPDTVHVKAKGCYRAACFGTSGIYVCNVRLLLLVHENEAYQNHRTMTVTTTSS